MGVFPNMSMPMFLQKAYLRTIFFNFVNVFNILKTKSCNNSKFKLFKKRRKKETARFVVSFAVIKKSFLKQNIATVSLKGLLQTASSFFFDCFEPSSLWQPSEIVQKLNEKRQKRENGEFSGSI